MTKLDEKQLFFDRLAEIKKQRKPVLLATLYREFMAQSISRNTLNTWRKEWEETEQPDNYDSDAFLRSRTPEADQSLIASVLKGNQGAFKIYYELLKRLEPKTDVKVTLERSAEERAREYIETQQWLREHGYLNSPRIEPVQPESALLPEQIREDTPSDKGDNPV